MKLTILYFARLREAIGASREEVAVPADVADVAALRRWLIARGEPFASALGGGGPVRAAVDQVIAADGVALRDGAEVAFFPPVTGG